MKALTTIVLLMIFTTARLECAGDTVFIEASDVNMMLVDYLDIIYSYDVLQDMQRRMPRNPGVEGEVNAWMETEEGHFHCVAQTVWDDKYASFRRMYPQRQLTPDTKSTLKQMVMLHTKIFLYTSRASIMTVRGEVHSIIFYDDSLNDRTRWHLTLHDPVFRKLYETGVDENGVSWYYKIHQRIQQSPRRR